MAGASASTASMDERSRQAIRGIKAYAPGKPIEEVRKAFGLRSVVKLASNENPLGPSPKAVAALRRATASLHRYPDATCAALKQALAKRFTLDPSWFCVGNGSDELLVLALRAFVDPGEQVVVADPTFLIYALQATVAGASVVRVPLKGLRYDLAAMRQAITPSTKLVFIANPDNPTGSYVKAKELDAFLADLPHHVIIVLDEAYYEFAEANDFPRSVRYLDRGSVLVTRTFSKAYGLAGLRVGYCIGHPSLIRALEAVREPFNVNSLAQVAACAALEDRAFLQRTRQLTRQGRAFLTTALTRLGLRVMPTSTNFILVHVGHAASELSQALLERGVIVREMSAWKLTGFIRVTIGTMAENRRLVQSLTACLINRTTGQRPRRAAGRRRPGKGV